RRPERAGERASTSKSPWRNVLPKGSAAAARVEGDGPDAANARFFQNAPNHIENAPSDQRGGGDRVVGAKPLPASRFLRAIVPRHRDRVPARGASALEELLRPASLLRPELRGRIGPDRR